MVWIGASASQELPFFLWGICYRRIMGRGIPKTRGSTNQYHHFENQCLGIGYHRMFSQVFCWASQISLEMAVVVGWLDSAKHCSPRNLVPPMGA